MQQQQQQHHHHQLPYKSHEMFEQQTQPEAKPNSFGKYENEPFNKSCSGGNGAGAAVNSATGAEDGKNNQMVVITLNGANGAASAQQKQVNIVQNTQKNKQT